MKKEKVILLGSGGHAKVVIDILEEMGKYEIIGITTRVKNNKDYFKGYPVLGDDTVLYDLFNQGIKYAALGVGGFANNNLRRKIFSKLKNIGFEVVSIIHPSAVISKTVTLGEGVVVCPGVAINADAHIGNNVILYTGSIIDHESIIEDHVLIATGTAVGANCLIKEGALLALGSKVISGTEVGKNVCVAAGAVVVNDIDDNLRVFGVPARVK